MAGDCSLGKIISGTLVAMLWCGGLGFVGDGARGQEPLASSRETPPPIFIEFDGTTWMPRGRILLDVVAVLRNKLTAAGLTVAREKTDPRALTLHVDYREERGEQFGVDVFGTVITCHFHLVDAASTTVLDLTVHEQSGTQVFGVPLYIEAIQKFETNPSVYFLGEIILGRVLLDRDGTASLIAGLRRLLETEPKKRETFDPLSAPHTMVETESTYAAQARDRTIQELGRLGDPRAIPLLTELSTHRSTGIRRLALNALSAIQSSTDRSNDARQSQ